MRTIKKYANRKLYDTVLKKYISLDEIDHYIEEGLPITVIDNQTGVDLTAGIMSRYMSRNQGIQEKTYLPEFIKKGTNALSKYARTHIPFSMLQNALSMAEDEFDRFINRLTEKHDLPLAEKRGIHLDISQISNYMLKWINDTAEPRARQIIARMNIATRSQTQDLRKQIDLLEQKVRNLETVIR